MIFDLQTGKFLEKTQEGVVLLNRKGNWLFKGDLFVAEDGRKVISDLSKRIDLFENTELFDSLVRNAKAKNKLYEIM